MIKTAPGGLSTELTMMPSLSSRYFRNRPRRHHNRLLMPASDASDCTTRKGSNMNKAKQKRLEKLGWKVGSADEFLELNPQESAYVELKLALSRTLQDRRRRKKLTQEQFARLIKSSQSRVAKMEAGDPTVSIDLLVRSLLALGAPSKALARSLSI